VGGALDPRHTGGDEAVVLKEVQVLPGEAGEIVRLAGMLAFRTGEQGAAFRRDFEVEFIRPLGGVESLADELPRRAQTEAERKHLLGIHPASPLGGPRAAWRVGWRNSIHRPIHLERRGG
jgi:hypothetical protein